MPQTERYADLHCHPADLIYHRLRGKEDSDVIFTDKQTYHPWNRRIVEKFLKQIKGKRAGSYLQSNPPKMIAGKTKLAFASLYPLEDGFVARFKEVHSVGNFFARLPFLRRLALLANRTVLNMRTERYKYLKGKKSRYYDELQAMYQFYVNGHDLWQSKHLLEGDEDKAFTIEVAGEYELCRNFSDVDRVVNEADPPTATEDKVGRTAIVFTIEGLHAFGIGQADKELKDVDFQIFKDRIIEWKTNKEFPIFFITFSHHFNNRLCGHAHSLPKITSILLDQLDNMGSGFSADGRGLEIVDLLLGIGQYANQPNIGKRILIDVKHMSPKGRKRYYDIVKNHNLNNAADQIPIIASHVGFSGEDALIDHMDEGKSLFFTEKDNSFKDGFLIADELYTYNPWGINMCGEDVVEIVRSKGLIGLSLDQRVMAGKRTTKFANTGSVVQRKQRKTRIVLHNILGMVQAVRQSNLSPEQQDHIWDAFTFGTDFDGYIDPIDSYPTSKHFAMLHNDLAQEIALYNIAHQGGLLSPWAGKEFDLMNKIGFTNAFEFLRSHF